MNKKKILLAPNSFKECADSTEVANLFEKQLQNNNELEILKYPISDGGDGFLNTLQYNFELKVIKFTITTAYDDSKFECEVLYDEQNKTVYIESAKVLGLKLIPLEKRHPLHLNSKGLGELLEQINESINKNEIDANKVIIGIGGTGTNDLGLGVCSVFGMKLIDIYSKEVEIIPINFQRISKILWNKPNFSFKIIAIVDVNNPLLGEQGASRQFAGQKGASDSEINLLELGFNKIINLLSNKEIDISVDKLSGAGGGLAAGLSVFFGAECISSSEYIERNNELKNLLEQADYVVTGEGVFDKTSLLGKGASSIITLSDSYKKQVFLCCGKIEEEFIKKFDNVIPIVMNKTTKNNDYKACFDEEIKLACEEIIRFISN